MIAASSSWPLEPCSSAVASAAGIVTTAGCSELALWVSSSSIECA
jgi:hypothetical protein